jgi:hypothetical protein
LIILSGGKTHKKQTPFLTGQLPALKDNQNYHGE